MAGKNDHLLPVETYAVHALAGASSLPRKLHCGNCGEDVRLGRGQDTVWVREINGKAVVICDDCEPLFNKADSVSLCEGCGLRFPADCLKIYGTGDDGSEVRPRPFARRLCESCATLTPF